MRVLTLLFTVALAGCGSSPPEGAKAPVGPVVGFAQEMIDLGSVDSESEREVVFELRNHGDAELRIERVDTTCGCAKPRFPKTLQPGESGQIVVLFAPEPVDAGLRTEGVSVATNAREAPFELGFRADLQPLLRLSPGTPLVVPIEPGGTATQMVALTPRRGTGIEVERFASADPRVAVERVPMADGSFAAKLTVRSPGPGDFIALLSLEATHPRLAAVVYQVGAQAASGPVSKPPELKVPALSPEAKGTVFPELVVFARDRAVTVLSANAPDPALEVSAGEPNALGTPIRVTYRGGWSAGTKRTVLVVQTDHPRTPVLRVPLEVKVN